MRKIRLTQENCRPRLRLTKEKKKHFPDLNAHLPTTPSTTLTIPHNTKINKTKINKPQNPLNDLTSFLFLYP
ncbi:hypothetical protein O6P43_018166 [Quillaja saponaria]|uniref:Uncharacterized protein n=1 Tax=Quillaja saponaria TaxID=32244 RepID=A0AAD7LRJ9_QUISA|nr:hypothetical protein O6P43_018166 [Quillaja saponaria]